MYWRMGYYTGICTSIMTTEKKGKGRFKVTFDVVPLDIMLIHNSGIKIEKVNS